MGAWSLYITIIILVINTIVSVAYMVYNYVIRRRFHRFTAGLVMLICPIIGPLYYALAYVVFKIDFRKKLMYDDDINFSKSKVENVMFPDYENEIQAVPLEEVFIVSNNQEKRKALLNNLKKDFAKSLGTISKALDDEDVETSHYAATAIMNATSDFLVDLKGLDDEFQADKDDYEVNRTYATYVWEYLNSGILDDIKILRYGKLYVELMENLKERHRDLYSVKDVIQTAEVLMKIKQYEKAEGVVHEGVEIFGPSEQSFISLLENYYETGQSKKFFLTLDEMKKSDISLSQKGVEFVRFFTNKGSVTV